MYSQQNFHFTTFLQSDYKVRISIRNSCRERFFKNSVIALKIMIGNVNNLIPFSCKCLLYKHKN